MRYMWLFSLDTAGKVFVERKKVHRNSHSDQFEVVYTAKTKVHY